MTRIAFASEPCSRCCGTGHYSRCYWYGTMCFKCSGRKTQLSRSGKASRKRYDAWSAATLVMCVEDVQAGQMVKMAGFKAVRVQAIAEGCAVRIGDREVAVRVLMTADCNHHLTVGTMVQRLPTSDELRAIAPKLGKGAMLVEGDK